MSNNKAITKNAMEIILGCLIEHSQETEENTETKPNDEYDYFTEIVKDSVLELKHGHTAYVFNTKQVTEIQNRINCNVERIDDHYELTPIRGTQTRRIVKTA